MGYVTEVKEESGNGQRVWCPKTHHCCKISGCDHVDHGTSRLETRAEGDLVVITLAVNSRSFEKIRHKQSKIPALWKPQRTGASWVVVAQIVKGWASLPRRN